MSQPVPVSDELAAATPAARPSVQQRSGMFAWSAQKALRMLRLSNFLNALLLIVLYPAILFLQSASLVFSFQYFFLMGYSILFALILLCFECHLAGPEQMMRRNFGFLFSFNGRALYLIFLSTICFILKNTQGYVLGSITVVNGIFNFAVICSHPAFSAGSLRSGSSDPTQGYTRGGDEARLAGKRVVEQNPDLARRAAQASTQAAVDFARSNPDAVREVVVGAVAGGASAAPQRQTTSDGFDVSRI